MLVCQKCQVPFGTKKIGVYVLEKDNGLAARLWKADLLECPGCGARVLDRFGHEPIAESFEQSFFEVVREVRSRAGKFFFEFSRQIFVTRGEASKPAASAQEAVG